MYIRALKTDALLKSGRFIQLDGEHHSLDLQYSSLPHPHRPTQKQGVCASSRPSE